MEPKFLKSAYEPRHFPPDRGREVAFAGRSNSGKSTAINSILARKNLARTSKTPGRTQLINFFELGEERRIVDLPGYGYARVAAATRAHWRDLLEAYFRSRRSLAGLMVTIDARRGPNDLDGVMLRWADEAQVPATVLLTKADKLSRGAGQALEREIAETLELPVLLFSAPKRQGLEDARSILAQWLDLD